MAISADLGPTLEKYVGKLVKQGRYNSKSEVMREGLRLLQEREQRLEALNASLDRGLADSEAGRITPAKTAFARLRKKYGKSK